MGLGSGFERADEISEKKRGFSKEGKKNAVASAPKYTYPQFSSLPPSPQRRR